MLKRFRNLSKLCGEYTDHPISSFHLLPEQRQNQSAAQRIAIAGFQTPPQFFEFPLCFLGIRKGSGFGVVSGAFAAVPVIAAQRILLPGFTIVGLPDAAVRESRDRVRAAVLRW